MHSVSSLIISALLEFSQLVCFLNIFRLSGVHPRLSQTKSMFLFIIPELQVHTDLFNEFDFLINAIACSFAQGYKSIT